MYRQQQANVPNGRGYPTEVAGRDRAKFFRRPVEPDNTVLDQHADTAPAQFAASCPSFTMPSNAALLSDGMAGQSQQGRVRGPRRPSSSLGWHPRHGTSATSHRAGGRGGAQRSHEGGGSGGRPHHLPRLPRDNTEDSVNEGTGHAPYGTRGGRATTSVQTTSRENEAQTDPYSPDYYIADGAPVPEVLSLQGLTYQNGSLPAGREEVQLIQRLRRRREVEAALPAGNDAASAEARYTALHALEEREWAEREEHATQLQQRRLDRLKNSLLARESAREEANRERLEQIKAQYLETLNGKLTSLEKRRTASSKRGNEKMAALQAQGGGAGGTTVAAATATATTRSGPSIATYARYGISGAPPAMDGAAAGGGTAHTSSLEAQQRAARQAFNYDVRPQLLSDMDGTQLVDAQRGARLDAVPPQTFVVPANEAVQRLPTLYQRREAERVLQSLEYAHRKIQRSHGEVDGVEGDDADAATASRERLAQQVLDLYRATPKVQRPATPVLELDGDDDEAEEDACILLQRLLRGRAVQNDFFEGRERCRGLIEELQAASSAQTAEMRMAAETQHEAAAAERAADFAAVLDTAIGAVVHDTLGFLTQELLRQQDMAELRQLHESAEAVRQTREAAELARRAEVRQRRDRNEVAYAAYMRATDATVQCFLDDVVMTAVEETALGAAVAEEAARQAAQPSPREPATNAEAEAMVCDLLDGFVLPTVVEAIQLRHRTLEKKAVAEAAVDAARAALERGQEPGGS